ncbi:MAG: terminase small subunit, partial [Beijerinckiaceae bacterium]
KDTSIHESASRLLKNVKVSARIEQLSVKVIEKAEQKFDITADKVLQRLAAIAFAQPGDYYKWGTREVEKSTKDGSIYLATESFVELKPSDELTDIQKLAIAGAEMTISKTGEPVVSVKMADRRAALVDLGKHLKLFTDKHEHAGDGGGPVNLHITGIEADL